MSEEHTNFHDKRRDWLAGYPAIFYDQCSACSKIWYLPQTVCSQCGCRNIHSVQSSGEGVVYACTLVSRAPTAEMKTIAPYLLVFVDAVEGFRMMAHGQAGLRIGDVVKVDYVPHAGYLMPVFVKRGERAAKLDLSIASFAKQA